MDPNNSTAPTPEVPNASAEVPTSTTPETTTAAPEHKKSLLDSIMGMFGMGPKDPSTEPQTQPEVPANPGTPQVDAANSAPTPTPENPPAVGLSATPEPPKNP